MIAALQRRFVVSAMIAVTILLVVVLGAVNLTNYAMTERYGDRLMEVLIETEGAPDRSWRAAGGELPMASRREVLEARYFLLRWNDNGDLLYTDTEHTFAVTPQEAIDYGREALQSNVLAGDLEQFRFRIVPTRDDGAVAVFLDMSAQRRSVGTVFWASLLGGIVCWIAMFILVRALSRRAIRPIAENIERQKQFVTDAGHEIKTPLAIILANTEAMELRCGETKWSRNIRAQTARLSGLMENLLMLAKMDEQRAQLVRQEFDLSALTQEQAEAFRPGAELRGAALEISAEPGVTVCAVREQIEQVVTILLDNAVKYVSENGAIRLFVRREGRSAVLQVKNTCDALPNCPPENLFDRFYRADGARTQKNGGYGIGLAMAQTIAHVNGGAIKAAYEGEHLISMTVRL